MTQWLVCPACGDEHIGEERFCPSCGTPLVHATVEPGEEFQAEGTDRTLRRISRSYTDGPLVRVAWARHQAEAELIQGLLSESGVPSLVRRARGFDVPDMLAAGPRDVLVPESGVDVARQVLLQHDAGLKEGDATDPPWRVLAFLTGGVGLVGLIAWLGTEVLR